MTLIENLLIVGEAVGLVLFLRRLVRKFPAYIVLKVDTHGKNNPDLVIGISKIIERYDKSSIIERRITNTSCSMSSGKLWIQISTIQCHKRNIIKDISQYMTQGFAYLSYEIES